MFEFYRHVLYAALLAGTLIFAGWRGGAPERLAALTVAFDVFVSLLVVRPWRQRFGTVEIGMMLIDAVSFVALVAITLFAERHWPRWLAGLKLVQVLSHLPIVFRPEVNRFAYHMLVVGLSWPELLILIVATWRHRSRMLAFGSDRSWSVFSSP